MPRSSTLGKIEKEIERLSPKDQLRLVEKLAHQLRKTGVAAEKELDWKTLYGLGKGLWKGEESQEYVNRLREDRVLPSRKNLTGPAASSSTQLRSSLHRSPFGIRTSRKGNSHSFSVR